jgi:hypothetical protein
MKKIFSSLFLAILMASFVVLPSVAQAGTSYIYLQGGQGEAPSANPCAMVASAGSNTLPYTVPSCSMSTADTAIFHFVVPIDYNPTTSLNNVQVTINWIADSDTDTGGLAQACWKASITVYDAVDNPNYLTVSPAAVGPATGIVPTTGSLWGKWTVQQSTGTLPNFYLATGGYCNTGCATSQGQAVLKIQRVAATICNASYTELSGAANILSVDVRYAN